MKKLKQESSLFVIFVILLQHLYNNKIISEKTFDRIIDWDNEKDKEKDDFEL